MGADIRPREYGSVRCLGVARRGDQVELQIVGEYEVRGRTRKITVWTLA